MTACPVCRVALYPCPSCNVPICRCLRDSQPTGNFGAEKSELKWRRHWNADGTPKTPYYGRQPEQPALEPGAAAPALRYMNPLGGRADVTQAAVPVSEEIEAASGVGRAAGSRR